MRVLTLFVSIVMSALTVLGSPIAYSIVPLVASTTPVTFEIIR